MIDDGRSFEHLVKLQGGQLIAFTPASGFGLNPFSMIDAAGAEENDDDRLDCFAMVKAIVGQMTRHVARLSDPERGLIDRAVNLVWTEHGLDASVTKVGECLAAMANEIASDLATSLGPFTAGGTHAAFFEGQASLDLEADFTVFEMSDLAPREDALYAGSGIGHGDRDRHTGVTARLNELLSAVQNPIVAIAPCARPQRRCVRSGTRFSQAERTYRLSADHWSQVSLPLQRTRGVYSHHRSVAV